MAVLVSTHTETDTNCMGRVLDCYPLIERESWIHDSVLANTNSLYIKKVGACLGCLQFTVYMLIYFQHMILNVSPSKLVSRFQVLVTEGGKQSKGPPVQWRKLK